MSLRLLKYGAKELDSIVELVVLTVASRPQIKRKDIIHITQKWLAIINPSYASENLESAKHKPILIWNDTVYSHKCAGIYTWWARKISDAIPKALIYPEDLSELKAFHLILASNTTKHLFGIHENAESLTDFDVSHAVSKSPQVQWIASIDAGTAPKK